MKPIKETKVGQWLQKKAPAVMHTVGDLLPEKGWTGIVKKAIDLMPEPLTQEEKNELEQVMFDHEVELYKLEVADRDSARKRESDMMKSGSKDWLFNVTGLVGLASFGVAIWAIISLPNVANQELFSHMIGMVEGVALTIFAYYFGTSSKRSDKN